MEDDANAGPQQYETLLLEKEEEIICEIAALKEIHEAETCRLRKKVEDLETLYSGLQSKNMEINKMFNELKNYTLQVIEEAIDKSTQTGEKKEESECFWLKKLRASIREKISSLESGNFQLQNDILMHEFKVARLHIDIKDKDNKIKELLQEIDQKDMKLESRKHKKKEFQTQMIRMQNELQKKEFEGMIMECEMRENTQILDEMKNKAESRKNELEAAQAKLKRIEEELHQKEIEKVKQEAEGKLLSVMQDAKLKRYSEALERLYSMRITILEREIKQKDKIMEYVLKETYKKKEALMPSERKDYAGMITKDDMKMNAASRDNELKAIGAERIRIDWVKFNQEAESRFKKLMEMSFSHRISVTQMNPAWKPKHHLPRRIGIIFCPEGSPECYQIFKGPTENHEDLEECLKDILSRHDILNWKFHISTTEKHHFRVMHDAGYSVLARNFDTDRWEKVESFENIVDLWEDNGEDEKFLPLVIVHQDEQEFRLTEVDFEL